MNYPAIILISVICVLIGIAIDSLLRRLPADQPASPPPATSSTDLPAEPAATPPPPPSFEEIAHLWRDVFSQKLAIGMGGRIARVPEDLSDEQRRQIHLALAELSVWLGEAATSGSVASSEAVQPPLEGLPSARQPASYGIGVGETAAADLAAERPRSGINPVSMLTNALRADLRKPGLKTNLSLAAQVDEVLQEKLIGTPWEMRNIHLKDAPDGGLMVQVGMDKYDGIEAVPDDEIRQLIRDSAEEWRKRMLPG